MAPPQEGGDKLLLVSGHEAGAALQLWKSQDYHANVSSGQQGPALGCLGQLSSQPGLAMPGKDGLPCGGSIAHTGDESVGSGSNSSSAPIWLCDFEQGP